MNEITVTVRCTYKLTFVNHNIILMFTPQQYFLTKNRRRLVSRELDMIKMFQKDCL